MNNHSYDRLDPQVATILDGMRAAMSQTTATQNLSRDEKVAAFRANVASFTPFGFPQEPIGITKDIAIPGANGELIVRLYVPCQELVLPAPVLLYCHGGGFVAGSLDDYDTALRAIANRAACLIVSVAYRLAPEHPYPAANDDIWAALKWLSHATDIPADPRRIAVGGDSAGGMLAAWAAQKAKSEGLPLSLQVLLYPSLDATVSSQSWNELGTGAYVLQRDKMLDIYDCYLPHGIDRRSPHVSPTFATDLAGLPPALIITAEYDPLRDEGNDYAAKLRAAGVPTNHYCWPGMIHGLLSLAGVLDAGGLLIDRVANHLRQAFTARAVDSRIDAEPC